MKTTAFERFAGVCAILAGIAGFLYSLAFIVIARSAPTTGVLLSALFLTLGGLLTTVAVSRLYMWQEVETRWPAKLCALLELSQVAREELSLNSN